MPKKCLPLETKARPGAPCPKVSVTHKTLGGDNGAKGGPGNFSKAGIVTDRKGASGDDKQRTGCPTVAKISPGGVFL